MFDPLQYELCLKKSIVDYSLINKIGNLEDPTRDLSEWSFLPKIKYVVFDPLSNYQNIYDIQLSLFGSGKVFYIFILKFFLGTTIVSQKLNQ